MSTDPYITIVWDLSLGAYKLLLLYSDKGKVLESWWSDTKKYSELA